MQIHTQRLLLRTPRVEDAQDYMEFVNSEFVLRYNAMTPKTMEQVITQLKDPKDMLVLERKTDQRVIGAVFLEEDSLRWGVASRELSYFLREDASRQGYMKEALYALIGYLFREEKLECVAARAFAPNQASLALLKSLGFHRDGYIPRCVKGYGDQIFDDTLHSLLCTEYA